MLLLLSRIARSLSKRTILRLGRWLGYFWYYVVPVRRRIALENVRRVFPEASRSEQRRIVRDSFVHLATYSLEVLRIPGITVESEELMEFEGLERLDEALARGKGAILFVSHVGNVDLAGASLSLLGYPICAVVKDLGKSVRDFIDGVRHSTGLTVLPPRKSAGRIRELLASNKIMVLVSDQHVAKHRALVCDVFGYLAACTPAAARFALETGAPVLPGVCYRRADGSHGATVEAPIAMETPYDDRDANIRHNTERLNRAIERWVRAYPEQWHWVHKRWKVHDDPEGWPVPDHLAQLVRR